MVLTCVLHYSDDKIGHKSQNQISLTATFQLPGNGNVETTEDVMTWTAGFSSKEAIEELGGSPVIVVSKIIQKELLASLSDNDSGLF